MKITSFAYLTGNRIPEGMRVVHSQPWRTGTGKKVTSVWLQSAKKGLELCKCGWRPELGDHHRRKRDLGEKRQKGAEGKSRGGLLIGREKKKPQTRPLRNNGAVGVS